MQTTPYFHRYSAMALALCWAATSFAQESPSATQSAPSSASSAEAVDESESPWLVTPLVSSAPKLGTSGGGLAAYMYRFDPQSSASMFGLGAIYTSTDSVLGGVFGKAYFNNDRDRLTAFYGGGKIHNDYADFGGSGVAVQTTDQARGLYTAYLHDVGRKLFMGAQAAAGNYSIWLDGIGDSSAFSDDGISSSFDMAGAGLIIQYDDRDHQTAPTAGYSIAFSNMAFRESLGSDTAFDTYTLDARYYLSHAGFGDSDEHVLAMRLRNKWTHNAPAALYSSVSLHGYKSGEYLAPHVGSVEIEERYRMARRWRLTGYAGVARLYGNNSDVTERWYPAIGIGTQFVLKEREKIVVSFEYARGIAGNYGLYLRLGQSF